MIKVRWNRVVVTLSDEGQWDAGRAPGDDAPFDHDLAREVLLTVQSAAKFVRDTGEVGPGNPAPQATLANAIADAIGGEVLEATEVPDSERIIQLEARPGEVILHGTLTKF